MKKIIISFLSILIVLTVLMPVDAFAAKKKSKGMSDEELTAATTTINVLLKKVYASALFTPKDNENMIDVKMQLDSSMQAKPSPEYAALYYKIGYVYNQRELRDDAIECYQTILDNFADSPYSLKAMNELKKMGVKIVAPAGEKEE